MLVAIRLEIFRLENLFIIGNGLESHGEFAGPFLGHMWLIFVDAQSKWAEVDKMNLTTASVTIKCLCSIFGTFELPEQFITGNGPQWRYEEISTFCNNILFD